MSVPDSFTSRKCAVCAALNSFPVAIVHHAHVGLFSAPAGPLLSPVYHPLRLADLAGQLCSLLRAAARFALRLAFAASDVISQLACTLGLSNHPLERDPADF